VLCVFYVGSRCNRSAQTHRCLHWGWSGTGMGTKDDLSTMLAAVVNK